MNETNVNGNGQAGNGNGHAHVPGDYATTLANEGIGNLNDNAGRVCRNERERSLCADLRAIVALELAIGEQRSHQFGAGAVFSDRRNPAICILMKED